MNTEDKVGFSMVGTFALIIIIGAGSCCNREMNFKDRAMSIDREIKLKAIDALKSNIVIKLDGSDLKEILE